MVPSGRFTTEEQSPPGLMQPLCNTGYGVGRGGHRCRPEGLGHVADRLRGQSEKGRGGSRGRLRGWEHCCRGGLRGQSEKGRGGSRGRLSG